LRLRSIAENNDDNISQLRAHYDRQLADKDKQIDNLQKFFIELIQGRFFIIRFFSFGPEVPYCLVLTKSVYCSGLE
jgi:hypothetical protein